MQLEELSVILSSISVIILILYNINFIIMIPRMLIKILMSRYKIFYFDNDISNIIIDILSLFWTIIIMIGGYRILYTLWNSIKGKYLK